MLLVYKLAFLPIFFKGGAVRALELVSLSLLLSLEGMILVEPTVADGRLAARRLRIFSVLVHIVVFFNGLRLGQQNVFAHRTSNKIQLGNSQRRQMDTYSFSW